MIHSEVTKTFVSATKTASNFQTIVLVTAIVLILIGLDESKYFILFTRSV